ncbi:MAG: universal stress protein, partial [Halobacteriales archaeon]|nr:universal stress protein [Halobacteriales archaeon]
TLIRDTDIGVTLYHAADGEDAAVEARAMLRSAAEELERKGIYTDRISTRVVVTDTPIVTVGEAARDHDLVLVGESEPTLAAILFGEVHDRVASAVDRPVIVIRRAEHDDAASEGWL